MGNEQVNEENGQVHDGKKRVNERNEQVNGEN